MTTIIVGENARVYRVVGMSKVFMSLDEAIKASIAHKLVTLGWGAIAALKVAEDRESVFKVLVEHIEITDAEQMKGESNDE